MNPAADVLVRDGRERPEAGTTGPHWQLPALVAAVSVSGLALTILGAAGAENVDWHVLVLLAALAVLAERADLSLYGDSRVSLAIVPIFASLIIAGIFGLVVVVPVAVAASSFNRPIHKTLYNFGTLMLAGAAAFFTFDSFGLTAHAPHWPQVLGPTIFAGAINFTVNSILVAIAIAISTRSSIRAVWSEHFLWLWPHYLVLAVVGLAIASAYAAIGLWGIAIFLAPPIMMQLSVKQYVDRTTRSVLELREANENLGAAHRQVTSAMDSLGRAYDGTLRSLVAALDARDSETGGHSERVAALTTAIAEEMGISSDSEEGRYVQWGALLHDVGKIAVPDGILRKPGKLSDDEWATMRLHPRAGYEIVQSIEFLAPAAEIILAHHERYDGAGYPKGLSGQEIPVGARIFMIADTFDAITSQRPYKAALPAEEALAEILRHSGTQFDPDAVSAFLSVYQKRFVGRSGSASPRGQLSDSLKNAILEATARLEKVS